MRQSLKMLICVVSGLVLCRGASGLVPDFTGDQYRGIAERNAFGLKSPAQTPAAIQVPQLPKLVLTGITTILGDRRALLKLLPSSARPGEQAKEQSLILAEGQREGSIEVLKVDENAGSVKVNNSGTVVTLTFDKDGPKLPNTPPAAPAPVPAPLPLMNPPAMGGSQPTFMTATNLYNNAAPGPGRLNLRGHTLPTRTPRLPTTGTTGAPDASGTAPSTGQAALPADQTALPPTGQGPVPAGQMPPANGTAASATQPPADAQSQSGLSLQDQLLLLELQRELNANNQGYNQGGYAPSPSTPTPQGQGAPGFQGWNNRGMLQPGAGVPGPFNPGAGMQPNSVPLLPQ